MTALLPNSPVTIIEALHARVRDTPDQLAFRFIAGDDVLQELTYRQLFDQAAALQAVLRARYPAAARLVLMYPPGLEFVVALFAVLMAGQTAVPVVPPRGMSDAGPLAAIIANCAPTAILTSKLDHYRRRLAHAPTMLALPWLDSVAVETAPAAGPAAGVDPDALALIQYTSGSTSAPRGVMLPHRALAANLAMIGAALELNPADVGFSWLPHYHDMGLIGAILSPVHAGFPITLMAPAAFMVRPASWLRAMARYGATVCAAPNFAYEACSQLGEDDCAGLRLDRVRLMLCGAEPVRPQTLERFVERFGPCGLAAGALFPTYGLAEATLFVAGQAVDPAWFARWFSLDSIALSRPRAALPSAPDAVRLASMGPVHANQRLAIVDAGGALCADGQVGEIWVGGPNVGAGYWNNEAASAALFGARLAGGDGPYLRTGDAGFVDGGHLYIAGRLKDLIIIRGKNHYPQDIEAAVMQADRAIRPDAVVAFAQAGEGGEALVVVVEIARGADPGPALFQNIERAVAQAVQLRPAQVLAVARGALPRTSSGKLQRARCAQMVADGTLAVLARWSATDGAPTSAPALPVARDLLPLYLLGLEHDARSAWLLDHIKQRCAALLRVAKDAIDESEPLYGIGLDSIEVAQELNELRQQLQIDIDNALLWQAGSIADLAELLARQLAGSAWNAPEDALAAALARMESMSDEEVERLLAADGAGACA